MNIWAMAFRFGWPCLIVIGTLIALCLLTLWIVIRKPVAGDTLVIVCAKSQVYLCAIVVPIAVLSCLWQLDGQTMYMWLYNMLYLHQYCLIQGICTAGCVALVLKRYRATMKMTAGDVLGLVSALMIVVASIAAGHAAAMITRLRM